MDLTAVAHELKFWTAFVKTERFLKQWAANAPNPELPQSLKEFIFNVKHDKIMDVGSGAVSILHGLGLNVIAFDPLGGLYECIFDYKKHKIAPPIPIAAELLTQFRNDYDIVFMRNALDHCQDPFKVIMNLVDACKIGGHVIVQCFENEADFENHQGFHQTNITLLNGDLMINREVVRIPNVRTVTATIETLSTGKRWVTWIAEKV